MKKDQTIIMNPNKRVWRKGENHHCEIRSIKYGKNPLWCLTVRGAQEYARQKEEYRIEQARIRRGNKRLRSIPCGLWVLDCL